MLGGWLCLAVIIELNSALDVRSKSEVLAVGLVASLLGTSRLMRERR